MVAPVKRPLLREMQSRVFTEGQVVFHVSVDVPMARKESNGVAWGGRDGWEKGPTLYLSPFLIEPSVFEPPLQEG
jgi:hypothetical protein